jgi:3-hydroxybutyryl-CoA dehydrogenase
LIAVGTRLLGILGSGTTGSGIAEACGRAGVDAVVCEATGELADAACARIDDSLLRALARRDITVQASADTSSRIRFTNDANALADCQVVFSAVQENVEVKRTVMAALDRVVGPRTTLVTTTSSFR